jgi:hypothetical protein
VLEVVEDEQRPSTRQGCSQRLEQRGARLLPDAECPGDRVDDEIRTACRREVDEHSAVSVLVFHGARSFQREAGFPDANRAGDREHPDAVASQELVQLFELSRSPDDRGDRSGQPGRNVHRRRTVVELRGVVQDVAFKLLERSARLEPELVTERPSRVAVDAQCIRLPSLAIEGKHELPAESLAQRLGLDQILELGDEAGLTSAREVCVDSRLERIEPEPLEPADGRPHVRTEVEVRERFPSPERKCIAKDFGGAWVAPDSVFGPPLLDKLLEPTGIDVVTVDIEQVAVAGT